MARRIMAWCICALMIVTGFAVNGEAASAAGSGYVDDSLKVKFLENGEVSVTGEFMTTEEVGIVTDQQYTRCQGGGATIERANSIHSGYKLDDLIRAVAAVDGITWNKSEYADYKIKFTDSSSKTSSFTVSEIFGERYTYGSGTSISESVKNAVPAILEVDTGSKINLYIGMDSYAGTNGKYWITDIKRIEIIDAESDEDTPATPPAGDTSWYSAGSSEFTLTDNDDLLGLATLVRGGNSFSGKTITLGNNITISGVWGPIGDETYAFKGTFDGNSKTVTFNSISLVISYVGLFGNNGGTIRNLTTAGSITDKGSDTKNFVAGVAGFNSGTIENTVNKATIKAENIYNVGGIAGLSTSGTWVNGSGEKDVTCTVSGATGIIKYCSNSGSILGQKKIGGIAGENAGTITSCCNTGKIDGSNNSSKNGVGGIAGRNGNNNTAIETGNIYNCYNTGAIGRSGQKWTGGITGFNNSLSSIVNCYDTGQIVSTEGYSNPIAGQNEGPGLTKNNYSLSGLNNTSSSAGGPYDYEVGIIKTAAQLKDASMIALLNQNGYTAYEQDTTNKNGGYPILKADSSAGGDSGSGTGDGTGGGSTDVPGDDNEQADQQAADTVMALISKLPAADSVTLDSESSILECRTAYNELTDNQKKLVSADALSKLTAAETKIAELKKQEEKPIEKITKPEKVAKITVKSGKKQAVITWKAVDKADGYQVYRSLKKTKNYKCAKTITKGTTVKYTNKGLKSKKTYYYKVRAYRYNEDGKKLYGAFSSVKSVKVK